MIVSSEVDTIGSVPESDVPPSSPDASPSSGSASNALGTMPKSKRSGQKRFSASSSRSETCLSNARTSGTSGLAKERLANSSREVGWR